MRNIFQIILHCSATPEGKDYTVEDITRWHKERGFRTIGYHYVIYRDGTVMKGRKNSEVGAHCLHHNQDSIGICYIGGVEPDNKRAKDTRTTEQKEALLKLVKRLLEKYHLTLEDIHCHNEYDKHKECPSFKIHQFREEYMKWIISKK